MRFSIKFITALFLVLAISVPLSASAAGFSFGGRVVAVIPCGGGMFHVTIVPSGAFPITYVWTPATITNLVGIPIPGGQIVGTADIPFGCFVGGGFFFTPIFLFGFRMQNIGTSLPSV